MRAAGSQLEDTGRAAGKPAGHRNPVAKPEDIPRLGTEAEDSPGAAEDNLDRDIATSLLRRKNKREQRLEGEFCSELSLYKGDALDLIAEPLNDIRNDRKVPHDVVRVICSDSVSLTNLSFNYFAGRN